MNQICLICWNCIIHITSFSIAFFYFIFSLFLCVSCLLFVSVLITCFFFLFTFCKHCMQKKCYDLRSLLCCKLHHTTSFPFISPLRNQPSIFATNRASLQAKENLRKCSWTSATVSMKDLLPHGQLGTWWKENGCILQSFGSEGKFQTDDELS